MGGRQQRTDQSRWCSPRTLLITVVIMRSIGQGWEAPSNKRFCSLLSSRNTSDFYQGDGLPTWHMWYSFIYLTWLLTVSNLRDWPSYWHCVHFIKLFLVMSRQECKSKKWEASMTSQGATSHVLCQLLPLTPTLRQQSPSSGTDRKPSPLCCLLSRGHSLLEELWMQTGTGTDSWSRLLGRAARHRGLQSGKHQLAEGRIHLQTVEVN